MPVEKGVWLGAKSDVAHVELVAATCLTPFSTLRGREGAKEQAMRYRYRLRTLLILMGVAPPLLAAAWLWCRPLILDALIILECQLIAAVLLLSVLTVVGLSWQLAKAAFRLTRHLLRLT